MSSLILEPPNHPPFPRVPEPFDFRRKPPYPHRPPKPIPPRRKPVTIAAGFKFNGGILLCADTEQTHGGVLKVSGSKLISA